MEQKVWITWSIKFCIRYSRLFWVYYQKHEKSIDNPLIRTCGNKIENRITFRIQNILLLTLETMKLHWSTKIKITKDENGKKLLDLAITQVVLGHCNVVNHDYLQNLRVMYTFVSNKSFGQLLDILLKNSIFLKTFNSRYF